MNNNSLSGIKQKVMLASLNISAWTGRAFDNNATSKVEQSYAKTKVGRFNKDLMPGKPESFEKILRAGSRLRAKFDCSTLEYQQLGVRLMTTAIYLDYTAALRADVQAYNILVDDFIDQYEDIKLDSKQKLGPLYNEFDYPVVHELREKFGVRFSVLPFPDAEQFGVDLPEADLLAVKNDIAKNMQEAVDFAYSDLSTRLYEATLKLAQRASSDGRFHSSAIENLREIIQILPKLNFTNDERLTALANQASRELTVFDADVLRSSPSVRSDVASRATAIAFDMAQYMGKPFDNSLLDDDPLPNKQMNLLAA